MKSTWRGRGVNEQACASTSLERMPPSNERSRKAHIPMSPTKKPSNQILAVAGCSGGLDADNPDNISNNVLISDNSSYECDLSVFERPSSIVECKR